ncbi:MAG: Sec-independent protein translocase protein TatB [Lautropia sp.]|nr:Sec-independent protein translocase protein TatB [Lautropia sp.]
MFDISFMEMLIVAVGALVIIGPERLPSVARQAGQWMSKARRYVEDVKSDFSQQIDLAELKSIKSEVEDSARSLERGFQDTVQSAQSSFDSLQSSLDASSDSSLSNLPLDEGSHFDGLGLDDPSASGAKTTEALAPTDWDKVYEDRRLRQRLKDQRIERERERGFKRPRFRVPR